MSVFFSMPYLVAYLASGGLYNTVIFPLTVWILDSSTPFSGISDVAEAYMVAIKGASAESHEALPQKSIQEKANTFSVHLRADQTTAVGKIQDGLQYLSYVVISTSMPVAWKN